MVRAGEQLPAQAALRLPPRFQSFQVGAVFAVAAVGRVVVHGDVSAAGAEKPFSICPGMHQPKCATLDTIRASDSVGNVNSVT
jgi:hypothetical protein